MDYINRLFPDFMELRGDRHYADDEAIVGGIALFHESRVFWRWPDIHELLFRDE